MKRFIVGCAIVLLALINTVYGQVPQKVTYQALLTTSSDSLVQDGTYGVISSLYDAPSGGTLLYQQSHIVSVQKGTFSINIYAPLDVPVSNVLFSKPLYIEITVVSGPGISSPITFSPRSELTSAPFALQSISLLGPNSIATGLKASAGGSYNRARGNYSVVAGGGGLTEGDSNSALGDYSAIGGGSRNTSSDWFATIGGGHLNQAGFYATVGGGGENKAEFNYATVSGGARNTASSINATVCGGLLNVASGFSGAVGGGVYNMLEVHIRS